MSVEMIALDRLVPAKQNVRVAKVSRDSQAALMASIAAEGLLQNLVVVPQGEQFAVIAGGRWLQALRGLAAAGRIAGDYPVHCAVRGSEARVTAISLAENFRRDAVHNPGVLDNFSLVIWNNVSGDVLTEEQRSSLKQWLADGGGWLGVHGSGGDTSYQWPWYVETLIGAQFIGHTMMPQFQDAELYPTDLSTVVTDHLPTPWRLPAEEWYAFDSSPRDKAYEILVTIDTDSYETHGPVSSGWMEGWSDRMGSEGEHPQIWRHRPGQGRAFYSAIGHQPETYEIPAYRELLSKAMRWAMGEPRE